MIFKGGVAQEFGCDDYCCIWIVWSRETYPQPWHLMVADAEVLVVMMAVVLCSLCSSTGSRLVCAIYALCGPVMFRLSLGFVRGCRESMVIETEAVLQVSFLWRASHCSLCYRYFGATLWAGPSDEHWHICSVWSCDEPYTTMIFEGRCFRDFVWHDFSKVFLTGIATFVLCGFLMILPPW